MQPAAAHPRNPIASLDPAQKLALLIDYSPLAVIEWTPQLEVVTWNTTAEQIFGFTAEEAIGHSAYDLIVPSDQLATVQNIIHQLLIQKTSSRCTHENLTQAGNRIYCEWFHSPLLNSENEVVGIISRVIDITENRKLAQQLQGSRQFFQNLINKIPDGILVKDEEFRYVLVNDALCEQIGMSQEDLLNKTDYDILSAEQADHIRKTDEQVLATGIPSIVELQATLPTGEIRYYPEVLKVRLRNEKRGTKCSILSSYNKKQRPMLDTFPKIVKSILQRLCAHDYPVLNSRLFFEIWLTFVLDKGLTSMRDLFYRLNKTGIKVDISTFSKACKTRQDQHFCRIYAELMEQLKRKNAAEAQMLFPIDSTVVTLTSKLFWMQGYHQVKLMNGLNLAQGNLSECLIHFGQGHDARFADLVTGMIPENGIGIMDRGFAGWEFLDQLSQTKTLFVVRIKNTMKTELDHQRYRVVWFCDLESKTEFRLATNVEQMTNEEIAEVYRHRWQIEVLWKFLKMHLKLDKLITKSMNGVTIQIYMVLIVYLILQLIEVSAFYGCQLLDKLRYLQLELSRRCSIVHWSYDLPETLVGVS